MNWVWESSNTVGTDRLVLLAIADRASDEGMDAWPSIGTLARKTRLHDRTVQRCIRNIEALGELEVRKKDGAHGTNVYVVRMDALSLMGTSRPNARRSRQTATGVNLPPGGTGATSPPAQAPPPPGIGATPPVAQAPPNSSGTSGTTSTSLSKTAASPRALAREPNTNGNYRVIERIAIAALDEDESFEDEGAFVDFVKTRCAQLGVVYGPPDEPADVVHRACASAKVKRVIGRKALA
jgi:hypothetical protein